MKGRFKSAVTAKKEALSPHVTKIISAKNAFVYGTIAAIVNPVVTYADDFEGIEVNSSDDMMSGIADTVGKICGYSGFILFVGSLIALIMAFKNEEVEGKHRAGLGIGVSLALFAATGIIAAVTGVGN